MLTERWYRELKKQILAQNDTCILCGHSGADSIDHIVPVSRGGAERDPSNWAPIHNSPCPYCGRRCNREKGVKLIEEIIDNNTSRDWFGGFE